MVAASVVHDTSLKQGVWGHVGTQLGATKLRTSIELWDSLHRADAEV